MKRILITLLFILSMTFGYAQNDDILLDYQLRKVIFKGNETFKDNQLKRIVDIKPVYSKQAMRRITYRFIKSQTKNLKNYYVNEGFMNCEIRDSLIIHEGKFLRLYFNIKENERFHIRQISVEGNALLSDGEILELLGFRIGDPFKQYVYYNNFKKILSRYSELGHPFATIREEYDWGPELEITLYINEDIPYNVNNINIKGNKSVNEQSIRKHLNIKPGDPFKMEKISQTRDRIYEMGAFNSVNIVPANPDSVRRTVNLDISVIESKARRFDVEFGARQGSAEKINYASLFFQPEWIHKNLFQRAHRLSIGFSYDALFHNVSFQNVNIDHGINAEIAYTIPWLISFRLPTTVKLYYNRNGYNPFTDNDIGENSILTDYGVNISSMWRYNRKIYTKSSFSLKNVKDEVEGVGVFEPLTEFIVQSRFDNRDNFIYPGKGWNILLYGGYVLGVDEETETEYFRLETSVNGYMRLFRNTVIAGRLEAGQFFDRKTINPIYLYQMGSETTVRGWFQSIGDPYLVVVDTTVKTIYAGKAKLLGNIELRVDLIWNFGMNVFLDAGRLDASFRDILNIGGYNINTGFGIYYNTPIGPVRLELPIIINDPHPERISGEERSFFNSIIFGLLFAF